MYSSFDNEVYCIETGRQEENAASRETLYHTAVLKKDTVGYPFKNDM